MLKLMIKQGYVPPTCVLDDDGVGSALILSEVRDGRDPCAGCRHDRAVCEGRPNREQTDYVMRILRRRDELDEMEREERVLAERGRREEGIRSPWEEF